MIRQLLVIAAVIGLWLFIRWIRKQPRQKQFQSIAILVAVVLIGFAVAGKLNWIFALFAALIPVFQRVLSILSYAPLFSRLFNQFKNSQSGNAKQTHSSVETEYFSMSLDHASGVMSGTIKKGAHSGEELKNLSITELVELYKEICTVDSDSAQLLEAYLDRTFKDKWRDQVDEELHANYKASENTTMTVDEAYNILGLQSSATQDEIIDAHRRLIQKLHPDRGGSDYLASKINQAKEMLLKKAA